MIVDSFTENPYAGIYTWIMYHPGPDKNRQPMKQQDTHRFIHDYKGLGAFGLDRATDEETIRFYLQKFSEDTFTETLVKRLSDIELEEIYEFIHKFLKHHISEEEYHHLFLKDR